MTTARYTVDLNRYAITVDPGMNFLDNYPQSGTHFPLMKRIGPNSPKLHHRNRRRVNDHCSALLWFTGLSGSGKSTLAHALEDVLLQQGVRAYVLDGDNIRTGLNQDLGLSPKDRRENVRRVGEVARLMADAGILVLAAFISPYRESREWVRNRMGDIPYFECYVQCPLSVCEDRDPKGLYRLARSGIISNMTGIAEPYEEPENPDIVIETNSCDPESCVTRLIQFLIDRGILESDCLPP
jgi:adenylylsulfate kinase